MLAGKSIAVVVPAYEEARWIERVIITMPAFVDRIVVVDDASQDRTGALAAAAAPMRTVDVLRQRCNQGVGAAIFRGYAHAFGHGADVVAVMAGDGQMDPVDLVRVVTPVIERRADYVKGDRISHDVVWQVMPKERLVGSFVLSALTSLAIGQRIRDSQCGFTALSSSAYARLDVGALWSRYGYPNDLLGVLTVNRQRVQEVVVRPVYRGEASGMRARHALLITGLIARAGWRRLRRAAIWREFTLRSSLP